MLGILVILIISWLLFHFVEKQSILALGFLPILKRVKQFVIGFSITAALCIIVQLLESFLTTSSWSLNEKHDAYRIAKMIWWDLQSVITEELTYRGVLLYILIRKVGTAKAIAISAVVFGVYHWFSFGIFGQPGPMFFIFIGTGLMGYAWALAFSKTKSIFMPIGLHLGWNATFNTLFSKGPLGDGLLRSTGGTPLGDWFSLIGLWVVPIIVLLIVMYAVTDEDGKIRSAK